VNKDSNKIEIKNAIESLYNVTVSSVNTAIMPGKPKSRNTKTAVVRGMKASYKKAFVTLTPGERIDIFGEE
jgi:large subunit ribosomal protein L23